MASIEDFHQASFSASGSIDSQDQEQELMRGKVLIGESEEAALVTLTNRRLLVLSKSGKPRELPLSDITKVKEPTQKMFGSKIKKPTAVIKTAEGKYEMTFTQPILSIHSPFEERDEFLRLIEANLSPEKEQQ